MGILNGERRARLERLGEDGRMYELLRYLEAGVQKGWYTREELDRDLEAALLRAYAWINIDTYEAYRDAAKHLELVEDQGARSGTWCYRYSVTLLYLGRRDESLRYARQGTATEPDYPWGWLQLARVSYGAGLIPEALEAVERGLELVPGDYEFLTTRREIEERRPLQEMLGHYIDPEADRQAKTDRLDRLAVEKEIGLNKGGRKQFD